MTHPTVEPGRVSAWCQRALLAFAASSALSACSLAIDLPADCEDADCAPYVCAADNIACETSCAADTDCVAGFVCNGLAGVCESAGCEPNGPPIALQSLPPSIDEFAVDIARNPDQLLVLLGRPEGLGLSRFLFDGSRIGDPIDASLGALPIASANADQSPFEPRIRSVDVDGSVTFRFAWRSNVDGRDRVEVAAFDPANPGLPVSDVVETSGARTLFDNPSVAPIVAGGEVVDRLFWRTTIEQSTELSTDRPASEDAPAVRLTDEAESVSTVLADRYSNAAMVAAAISQNGLERLDLLVVAPDGTTRGIGRLAPEQPAQQFEVTHIDMSVEGADWLVLWQTDGSTNEIRLATLVPEDVTQLVGNDPVGIPSVAVGRELEDVRDLDVTWRQDQIFLAWDAVLNGERNLYIARYDKEGTPVYATFAVLPPGTAATDGVRIVPSEAGIDVVWRERRDTGDGLFMQRYICVR